MKKPPLEPGIKGKFYTILGLGAQNEGLIHQHHNPMTIILDGHVNYEVNAPNASKKSAVYGLKLAS